MASLFRSLFGGTDDTVIPLPHFKKMSHHDRQHVAAILSRQPRPSISESHPEWVKYKLDTKRLIADLPGYLRSYPGKIERFLNRHIEDDARSQMRALCPMHDKLNCRVVRSTLAWIKKEIDINIPAILEPLKEGKHLTKSDLTLFKRLEDTSGMWIDAGNFKVFFKRSVHPMWARQVDRCAACVVARLAGEAKVVQALYAGMRIGRKYPQESRRMAYVECMIDCLDNSESVRKKSQELGERLQEKFLEWEASQSQDAGVSGEPDCNMDYAKPQSARCSMRGNEPLTDEPAQISRPANPRRSIHRQPSLSRSRTPPRKNDRPVSPLSCPESPKGGVYEPIPWRQRVPSRDPARQPEDQEMFELALLRPTKQVKHRDTIGDLIDEYRQTKYDPVLGGEDHFAFNGEEVIEDWPTATWVEEQRAYEAASKRDPAPPPSQIRPRSGARPSAPAPRPPPPERPRRTSSVYLSRPATAFGPWEAEPPLPAGAAEMTSARMSGEEMAQEYRRVIGRASLFKVTNNAERRTERALRVASDMTVWPRQSQGRFSFSPSNLEHAFRMF
jgi:hypothetical protein